MKKTTIILSALVIIISIFISIYFCGEQKESTIITCPNMSVVEIRELDSIMNAEIDSVIKISNDIDSSVLYSKPRYIHQPSAIY